MFATPNVVILMVLASRLTPVHSVTMEFNFGTHTGYRAPTAKEILDAPWFHHTGPGPAVVEESNDDDSRSESETPLPPPPPVVHVEPPPPPQPQLEVAPIDEEGLKLLAKVEQKIQRQGELVKDAKAAKEAYELHGGHTAARTAAGLQAMGTLGSAGFAVAGPAGAVVGAGVGYYSGTAAVDEMKDWAGRKLDQIEERVQADADRLGMEIKPSSGGQTLVEANEGKKAIDKIEAGLGKGVKVVQNPLGSTPQDVQEAVEGVGEAREGAGVLERIGRKWGLIGDGVNREGEGRSDIERTDRVPRDDSEDDDSRSESSSVIDAEQHAEEIAEKIEVAEELDERDAREESANEKKAEESRAFTQSYNEDYY